MKQHWCMRCNNIFTTERIYKSKTNKKICDKCLIKRVFNKNTKVIHQWKRLVE